MVRCMTVFWSHICPLKVGYSWKPSIVSLYWLRCRAVVGSHAPHPKHILLYIDIQEMHLGQKYLLWSALPWCQASTLITKCGMLAWVTALFYRHVFLQFPVSQRTGSWKPKCTHPSHLWWRGCSEDICESVWKVWCGITALDHLPPSWASGWNGGESNHQVPSSGKKGCPS